MALDWRSFRLYVITDPRLGRGRSHEELALAAARGGAGLIQIRDKHMIPGRIQSQIQRLCPKIKGLGASLVVNDWPLIARQSGAPGIHVGQNDLGIDEARDLSGGAFVGRSTHSLDQALRAQDEGADYVALGPIYGTRTKRQGSAPVGLGALEQAAARLTVPWVAIGGINLENLSDILEAGARRVAVVTAVCMAIDPAMVCKKMMDKIEQYDL